MNIKADQTLIGPYSTNARLVACLLFCTPSLQATMPSSWASHPPSLLKPYTAVLSPSAGQNKLIKRLRGKQGGS